MAPRQLHVGGFTPLTTIDFPGRLAAVVFCQGCPWRCGYCQNGELIPRTTDSRIRWEDILGFLERRRGLLDGVVFSGGEPTLQRGLPGAVDAVRGLGFQVGLHTAGPYPARLAELLPALDWVGLDIKAPPEDYERITGVAGSGERAWTSLEILLASGIEHEVRCTLHPDLLAHARIRALARTLAYMGVRRFALQQCQTQHCLTPELRRPTQTTRPTLAFNRELENLFPHFALRAA